MDTPALHAIHFYGDSLTAGYGAAPSDGWIPQLQRHFPTLTLYNHGVCGALFSDILEDAWTVIHYPSPGEALFLMGGTNDILSGISYEALTVTARDEIEKLSSKIPILLGIPPRITRVSITAGWQAEWQYEKNDEDLRRYGDFLRELAARLSIPVIDFQKAFPMDDALRDDGSHPNARGYTLFADIAAPVIDSLLKKVISDKY